MSDSTRPQEATTGLRALGAAALAALLLVPGAVFAQDFKLATAPTNVSTSLMRGAVGKILANRTTNAKHTGVDIVSNQSSDDKEIYRVMAVTGGVVAYSQLNDSATSGFGYTIVIDHGNGFYTQYSHLAIKASQGKVKVGETVLAGQTIGYMGDPANSERSSGNTEASSVKPYDKIQLHFEIFRAPAGAQSKTTLKALKNSCEWVDGTPELKRLGYKTF